MRAHSWLGSFRSPATRHAGSRKSKRPRVETCRQLVETLEERELLSFNPIVNYELADYHESVVAGYFNNDTVLDLAVANSSSGTVSVMLGNSGGTFQSAHDFDSGGTLRSLAVGDIDGDHNNDLVGVNGAEVAVLFGDGQGAFG